MTILIFSGGSTKAPLHVGVFGAIQEKIEDKSIKPVTALLGNSAGAIIAACIALGYDYTKLYKLALTLDFSTLLESSIKETITNIFISNYLNSGEKCEQFFEGLFGDITFGDIKLPLYLMTHCLNDRSYRILSADSCPELKLSKAVRMSMSVPLLFKPVEYDDKFYIDGGVSKDFPVDLANDFYIGHLIQNPVRQNWKDTYLLDFGLSLIDQLIQSNVETSIKLAHKNGIIIRTNYSLPTTQFKVDWAQKEEMIRLGYNNAKGVLECL